MKSKITTLVENTVAQSGKKLIGEHGLSFYIETESNKILFDTGQNLAISNNAKVLGIDLSLIDTVILSHGHYDHIVDYVWLFYVFWSQCIRRLVWLEQ